jgi:hypothetical protein
VLLRNAYSWLKRDAASGADGMTWQEYGTDLERKPADLRVFLASERAPDESVRLASRLGVDRHCGGMRLDAKIQLWRDLRRQGVAAAVGDCRGSVVGARRASVDRARRRGSVPARALRHRLAGAIDRHAAVPLRASTRKHETDGAHGTRWWRLTCCATEARSRSPGGRDYQ